MFDIEIRERNATDVTPYEAVMFKVDTELARAEDLHPDWPSDAIHAAAIVVEEAG